LYKTTQVSNIIPIRGAFSVVREGTHKETGKRVAIKAIKTRYIKNKLLIREIDIMKKVGNHPNILKLYEVYETKNFLYLVLELVTGNLPLSPPPPFFRPHNSLDRYTFK
jgi:serine/threonine protein kinase